MEQMTLFDQAQENIPLASRLRPESLDEFVGQEHLLGEGKMLRKIIESDQMPSMIFWGPPGVGKTTLASIIAGKTKADFINFSAVTSGIREIKEVMSKAESSRRMGVRTVLFVDEIHRFNKAQQDAFLPYVEKGSIVLIGATTENPSFEINSALLSRCRVFLLKPLNEQDLVKILKRSVASRKGLGEHHVRIRDDQLRTIALFSQGDARTALNTLEMVVINGEIRADGITVTDEGMEQCISRKSLLYDKGGEEHYNLISALHKSMRNSDPDAAVYWLCRMLEGGESPLYIARRLIRFASEDVGMADSHALLVAVSVYQACHFLGLPECDVHLIHAVTYLSMAPKSNALYAACEDCKREVKYGKNEPVPLWLRNAPTNLMKELDYGKGYEYAHHAEEKLTAMECLPPSLKDHEFYHPTDQGEEEKIMEKLERIRGWKKLQRERMEREKKE